VLSEVEVVDKFLESLGEAAAACRALASQADPERAAPRGRHYVVLKVSLKAIEGCCRQMATFRSDARWLKLGAIYGRALLLCQPKFVGQNWAWFGKIPESLDYARKSLLDLKDQKTGVRSSKPILPERASDWLIMPEIRPSLPGLPQGRTLH
jgi:hypothetical protein